MNDNFSEGVAYRFEALHNFRDLGGLRAADGKNIRRGLLFRSDSFHEASAADIRLLLDGVGLTCIIDLRAEHEVAGEGTNPLIPSTVSRRHFPIDGGAAMWLLDNGLPESSLAALRAHLIESTGEAA